MMNIIASFFKKSRFYKLLLLSAMLLYMSFISISLSGCVAAAPLVVASEIGMTGMVFANSPIVSATVTVYNAATGALVTTTTTGTDGTYSVSGLPNNVTYYVVATGGTLNGNPVNPYVYLLSVFNPQAPNNPKTTTGSYIIDLNESITVASLFAMVQDGAATSPISVNSSGQVSINTTISTTIINNAATTINSTFNTSSSNYNSSTAPPTLSTTAPNYNNISALGNALASCVNTSANCATFADATGDTPSTNSIMGVINAIMAPYEGSTTVNIAKLNTLAIGYAPSSPTLSTATSVAYTVSGTVNGGYGPLASAEVNLYEVLPTPTPSSSPLAAATTDSSGSYSFTYTYNLPSNATVSTAAPSFFVTAKASSGNLLYTAFNGSSSSPASITDDIDELTSAQFAYYLNSVGGSMTTSGILIPSSGVSNFTSGIANININETLPSSLSSSADDELYEVASALASCVQSSASYCSASTSLLPSSYVKGQGLFAYDLVLEYSATEAKALLAINAGMASMIPLAWAVPAAPASLTATPGNTQVSLSWSAVTGATSYNIYDSTSSGGPYTKVASSTNTSYSVTGLANGTAYYFVVTAVNSSGESGYSNQASATPVSPPVSAAMTAAMVYSLNTGASSPVIDEYSIDPATGVINPTASSVATGSGAYNLEFNGAGTFAYTMDSSHNLWIYSVSGGALTYVGKDTPTQYLGTALPSGASVDFATRGDTLYFVVGTNSPPYTHYAVPISSSGTPNASSEVVISNGALVGNGITYNNRNNILFIISPSSGVYNLEAFTLDPATGMITSATPVSTISLNSNPPYYVYKIPNSSNGMYIVDNYSITTTTATTSTTTTTTTSYSEIYDISLSTATGALTEIGSYTLQNPGYGFYYIVPNQTDLYLNDTSGDIYGCVNTSSSFSCSEVEPYSYLPSSSYIYMFFMDSTLYAGSQVLYPFTINSDGSLTLQTADEITAPANTYVQYYPMASDSALLAVNNLYNSSTTPVTQSSSVISYAVNPGGLVFPSTGVTTSISSSAEAAVGFINGGGNLMASAFDSSNNTAVLYDYLINSNGTLGSSPSTATVTITPPSGYSLAYFGISTGFPYNNNDYAYYLTSNNYYMNSGLCSAYPNECFTPSSAVYGTAYFYNTNSFETGIYGWQITSSGLTLMNGGTPIITKVPYFNEFFSSGTPLVISGGISS